MTETVNEGFTKAEGYVNLDNVVDSAIKWTVNVPVTEIICLRSELQTVPNPIVR